MFIHKHCMQSLKQTYAIYKYFVFTLTSYSSTTQNTN